MIKKALAIILILVLSFSTLTACIPSTDDLVSQIQEEFSSLVSDAAEIASIIASALASGIDLGGIVGEFLTIMSDITSISLTGIGELSSSALNSVRDTINNLTGTLLSLKVRLETAIGIRNASGEEVATDSSAQILSELADIKTALNELKSMVELLTPAEAVP